jgi:hypothetical protein
LRFFARAALALNPRVRRRLNDLTTGGTVSRPTATRTVEGAEKPPSLKPEYVKLSLPWKPGVGV